jgi:hypothetical protein
VTFITLLYPFNEKLVDASLRVRFGSGPGPTEVIVEANGTRRVIVVDLTERTVVRSAR